MSVGYKPIRQILRDCCCARVAPETAIDAPLKKAINARRLMQGSSEPENVFTTSNSSIEAWLEAEVAFMHTTLSLSRIGGTGAPSAFPDDGSNLARLPPCPLNPYQALL